ncbi:hypothetical protein [uncultured Microbulbifer sp.]|uniref:hypothetical protein n=1 Tax=uncultured Microbulbifer sp. TaxID=348147 RepID=UPI0026066F6B|nr:hypothetical protein [uncultured Microbulbifer sp.]
MKKFITAVSLTLAATGFAGLANAETWSPTGPVALASVEPLALFKGIPLDCDLMGAVTLNGSDASVGALQLSGGLFDLCNTITFTDLPYNLEGNADGTATMEGVVVQAVTGNCAGDLTGTFDQATGVLTFDAAVLPATDSGGDCTISGNVMTNPQASYTNP